MKSMRVAAPTPSDEGERIEDLLQYDILDTLPEDAYDAVTRLAAHICNTPIALISLVDRDRQWFKSRLGLEQTETPRDVAFCAHAITDPASILVVDDATADERFADNPLVTDDPSIRFYAGAPLVTPRGRALGTLCVIDRSPRTMTEEQRSAMQALASQVMALLELRWSVAELKRRQVELEDMSRQRETLIATVSHEVRTPLTGVVGCLDLLLNSDADLSAETRAELLATAASEAGDVRTLVDDLLVAAGADAGSLVVEAERVDVLAEVRHVLDALGQTPDGAPTVEMRTGGGCDAVVGDSSRIRQVIRNLITNADRYGGEAIRVQTTNDAGWCHLLVMDSGDAIPAEERDRMFLPHVRRSDRPGVAESAGLGLSVSRLLVERMGGSLVYGYEDGWSTFDVALPAPQA